MRGEWEGAEQRNKKRLGGAGREREREIERTF
jgi:hypothetical protein